MVKKTNLKTAEKEYVDQVVNETQTALYAMAKEWDEQKHASVLMMMEKIRDDFRIYGDAISGIHDNIKSIKDDISIMKDDISVLKEDVYILKEDVSIMKDDISVLKEDVYMLKGDVGQIKTYIFDNVEPRIHVLEFRDREMA